VSSPHSYRNARRAVRPATIVIMLAVLIGVPLWLVLITSVKSQGDALNPSLSLPKHGWHFGANYSTVFTDGRVWQAFLGSLSIVVPSVVLLLLFGAMASWVSARRTGLEVALR
jgi:raffinose/stachyose/melibiose transport system permease protein